MIDFKNASYLKLKQINPSDVGSQVLNLLIPGETVISAYKGIRDYVVFTDKRFISVNVQGITGKKHVFKKNNGFIEIRWYPRKRYDKGKRNHLHVF